ncbi:hypothetical protein ACFE04_005284 [Oxalis oulophora]
MDNQRNSLLNFAYYCQGKSMEELRHSLLYTTLELDQTRVAVQEELRIRDEQMINLKEMLSKAIKERDEAQENCQRLVLEKLILQNQQNPLSGISSIDQEDENPRIDSNNGFSSSDCEESIVSSPQLAHPPPPPPQTAATIELLPEKPLPEKGKLLQAVIKAGPLLQTLLLAGPLPQWRHPPPPLESFEIPPVTIPAPAQAQLFNQDPSFINRKRVLSDDSDFATETKYQRIIHH